MVVTDCCNSGNCTRQSPTRLLYALLRSLIEFSGEAQHTKQSSIKENNQKAPGKGQKAPGKVKRPLAKVKRPLARSKGPNCQKPKAPF